jgi:membrane-associated protease RseP (regulator of RpoE activity)
MPIKIGDLPENKPTNTVATVVPGSPAAAIGLQEGDQILEINGKTVAPHEIPEILLKKFTVPITLTVRRGGRLIRLESSQPSTIEGVGPRFGFTLRGGGKTPVLLRRFLTSKSPVAGVRG